MLKIFLISLFAYVAFALSDRCDRVRDVCDNKDDYGRNITIPENAEELDVVCEYTIKYAECQVELLTECENLEEAGRVKAEIPVLEHLCNKEGDLYKSLLTVLPCMKNELAEKRDGQCFFMYRDELARNKFQKILYNAGLTDVTDEDKCFHKYYFDACTIGSHGAICGIVARDIMLEMRTMFNEARQDECWDNIKEKMPDIVSEMEALYLESEYVLENMEIN